MQQLPQGHVSFLVCSNPNRMQNKNPVNSSCNVKSTSYGMQKCTTSATQCNTRRTTHLYLFIPSAERFKTEYVAPEKHSYLMRHEARKERFIQQRSGFKTGNIDPFSEVVWGEVGWGEVGWGRGLCLRFHMMMTMCILQQLPDVLHMLTNIQTHHPRHPLSSPPPPPSLLIPSLFNPTGGTGTPSGPGSPLWCGGAPGPHRALGTVCRGGTATQSTCRQV